MNPTRKAAILLLLLAALACSVGQDERFTDLYLVELSVQEGRITLGPPDNLTDREGWDNQPAFLPDGESFLYSAREEGQAEIYRYDLATHGRERLTESESREYSPLPIPGAEGFSAVRVEWDGERRLWRYDAHGKSAAAMFEWEDHATYYTWIDAELMLLYVEGQPSRLHFADTRRGWAERVPFAEDVGRCMERVPGRNAVSFVHKLTEDEWWITEADLLLREKRRLVRTQPGSEDFAWLPSGELLTAHGSQVFAWTRESGAWEEIADYSPAGLTNITRIAVDPRGRRLVLVAEREPPAR